jgi:hypothetical protein
MEQRIKLYSSQDLAEAVVELLYIFLLLIFEPRNWFFVIPVSFLLALNIYKFFKAEVRTYRCINEETYNRPSYEEFYSSSGNFEFYRWGFAETVRDKQVSVIWEDISKITVYKRDLYTEDQICLEFELANGYIFIVSEDVEWWFQLIIHLEKEFPEVTLESIMKIAHPPFERNETVLFSRNVTYNELSN